MIKQHIFHPEILRAYDIRGKYGKTLHDADASALGGAFASFLSSKGEEKALSVVVGYDGRHSSPALARCLAEGLISSGVKVQWIGLCPTPMLYFAVEHLGASAGVMVTGSHNVPDDNGFKIMLKGGKPCFDHHIQSIGQIARKGWFLSEMGERQEVDIQEAYCHYLLHKLKFIKPLKIVWDAGNGAACVVLSQIIQHVPGEHVLMNDHVDGDFPSHLPDPTKAENLVQLQNRLAKESYDLGIAFDGDADRVVVLDSSGRILHGDELLKLYSLKILPQNPGAVIIGDVKCRDSFFNGVKDLSGIAMMCKTGHSYIKEKILQTKAILAGEMSGHYFFKDRYLGYDDGIYAALRLIEILSQDSLSLKDWLDQQPQSFITPEMKIYCQEDKKARVIASLLTFLKSKGEHFVEIDGIRFSNEKGWWLIRSSNTEPAIILRAEAHTRGQLNQVLEQLMADFSCAGIEEAVCHYKAIRQYKL